MKRICVFCGSRAGRRDIYEKAARKMGLALSERGYDLVYGGGQKGLMGVIADTMLEQGRKVYGVIPHALATTEHLHTGLSELYEVETMHERKQKMMDLSDAAIAMPGGYGTLEELFEVMTWSQLGFASRPIGLLNVDGYYDHLISMIRYAEKEGFVSEQCLSLIVHSSEGTGLLDLLEKQGNPAPTKL